MLSESPQDTHFSFVLLFSIHTVAPLSVHIPLLGPLDAIVHHSSHPLAQHATLCCILGRLCRKVRRNHGPLPTFSRAAVEAAKRAGQNELTIRHWTLRGKLPATKHSAQCTIALMGVEPFQDSRPLDVKALLARVIALEDIEDVQASQASRLTVYGLPTS